MINWKKAYNQINWKNPYFKIILYWFVSMTSATVIVSFISFLAPFENMNEYKWSDIVFFESKYMLRTFYVILFTSYIVSAIGLIINILFFLVLKTKPLAFKAGVILANLLILWLVPYFWSHLGYHINHAFSTIILPVYMVSVCLFGIILLPGRKIRTVAPFPRV